MTLQRCKFNKKMRDHFMSKNNKKKQQLRKIHFPKVANNIKNTNK